MLQALLIIILFFILLFVIIGFGIIRSVFRIFFGNRQPSNRVPKREHSTQEQWHAYDRKKEKVFSKDEGEYIEFEEIKENKETQK